MKIKLNIISRSTLAATLMFAAPVLQTPAHAQSNGEAACRQALASGQLAWNKSGANTWQEANITNFCSGVVNFAAKRDCFTAQIQAGVDWSTAGNTCAATGYSPVIAASTAGSAENPPVFSNISSVLNNIRSDRSTTVDTYIEDFVEFFDTGGQITNYDHPSGITMTPSGRLVTTMSRTGGDSTCGALIYTYSNAISNSDPRWGFECILHDHPNSIQAVGDIVVVSHSSKSSSASNISFFQLPSLSEGPVSKRLTHLENGITTGEGVGIAYNPVDKRHYLAIGPGGVTPDGGNSTVSIYRTNPGDDLTSTSTRFQFFTSAVLYNSGQGTNLHIDASGKVYLVSFFSSDEQPPTEEVVGYCAALQFDYQFKDQLVWHEIDLSTGQVNATLPAVQNVGITQQQCIQERPSWRFGGGLAALDDGTMVALWAGRFKTVFIQEDSSGNQALVKGLSAIPGLGGFFENARLSNDDFEFSYQIIRPSLAAPTTAAATAPAASTCQANFWGGTWQSTYGPINVNMYSIGGNQYMFQGTYGQGYTLSGKLSPDTPCQIYGEWAYPNGTKGEFLFTMTDSRNFSGTWTSKGVDPFGKAVNWTGQK